MGRRQKKGKETRIRMVCLFHVPTITGRKKGGEIQRGEKKG